MHRCQKPTAQGASSGFYVFGYAVLYFSSRLLGLPRGGKAKGPGPSGEKTHLLGKLTNWQSAFLPYVLNLGGGFPI